MSTSGIARHQRMSKRSWTVLRVLMACAASALVVTNGQALAGRASSGKPAWHPATIPNVGYDAHLNAIAAISPSNAWAVGRGADHWDGRRWSPVPVPAPPNNELFDLSGLAVIPHSGGQLWAVGYVWPPSGTRFWILRWTGTRWKSYPAPNPGAYNYLESVTAVSPKDAWAVGYSQTPNDSAVALHWNGISWKQVSLTPGGASSALTSISAYSASDIWAVGSMQPVTGGSQPLVEQWNGQAWSVVATPALSEDAVFQGVTAGPAGFPLAVGFTANGNRQTLVEQWDGGQWNVIPSPSPGADDQLYGVAEDAQGDAWAVGLDHRPNSNVYRNLIEQWTGNMWEVDSVSNRTDASQGLMAISEIPGSPGLWAAGSTVQRWSGSGWRTVPAPNAGVDNYVNGTAMTGSPARTRAWAVGFAVPNNGQAIPTAFTRTVHGPWQRIAVADPPQGGQFHAMTAIGPSNIWAVGERAVGEDGSAPMAEHWNGRAWQTVNPPDPAGVTQAGLDGACATSWHNVWVGGNQSLGGGQPVFDHFAGAHWTGIVAPAVPGEQIYVNGMACAANGDVWAAGSENGSVRAAVILFWNGSSWSYESVAQPFPNCQLFGISLLSARDIWTVGECAAATKDVALIEHWNGAVWKYVKSPQPDRSVFLYGVTALGSGDVWSVGEFSSRRDPTLVEHWNGKAWTRDPSGSVAGGSYIALRSMAISPATGDGWAVGDEFSASRGWQTVAISRHR